VFGVASHLESPPAGLSSPQSIVRLSFREGPTTPTTYFTSYATAVALETIQGVVTTGAYSGPRDLTFESGFEAGTAHVGGADGSFFKVLGARPALGRFFSAADDSVADARVAVVSDAFMRDHQIAVGSSLRIGSITYTVIGSTPPGFTGAEVRPIDVWLPLLTAVAVEFGPLYRDPEFSVVRLVGRVSAGATVIAADTVLNRRLTDLSPPSSDTAPLSIALTSVTPASNSDMATIARVSLLVVAMAAAVLLVALTNVAALVSARALRDRPQTALRLALGVRRRRLLAQCVVEATALALAGAMCASGIAVLSRAMVYRFLLPDVAPTPDALDARLCIVIAVASLIAALVLAAPAATIALATEPTQLLRAGRVRASHGGSVGGRLLVVSQLALALCLMVAAALFARSSARVRRLPLGFNPNGLLVVRMRLPGAETDADVRRSWRTAADAVRTLDGVGHLTLATSAPFGDFANSLLTVPAHGWRVTDDTITAFAVGVEGDYAETMGLRLLAGRFDPSPDRVRRTGVVVVNAAIAKDGWGARSPLGTAVRVGDPPKDATVVGVIDDVRDRWLTQPAGPQLYVPLDEWPQPVGPRDVDGLVLLVRTTGDIERLSNDIRRAVHQALPDASYPLVRPVSDLVDQGRAPWQLGERMLLPLAMLAFIVALIGIYGMLDYWVTERRSEWAVRAAMGASPRQLMLVVGRGGAGWVLFGIAGGLGIAVALAPRLSPLLFNVPSRDPWTYVFVATCAGVVALGALVAPARHASQADPIAALRAE
jgi:predicted permease